MLHPQKMRKGEKLPPHEEEATWYRAVRLQVATDVERSDSKNSPKGKVEQIQLKKTVLIK